MSNAFWTTDLPSAAWMRRNLPWLAVLTLLFGGERAESAMASAPGDLDG